MALETSGFVPKGNLNTDNKALEKKGTKDTVKRLLIILKPQWFLMCLSLLLALFSVIFTLLSPVYIGKAIDSIIDSYEVMMKYLECAIAFAVCVFVTQYLMNLINNKISYKTVCDIRNMAVKKLVRIPFARLDNYSYGDVVSRVVADSEQLSDGLLMGFSQFFTGVVTIIGTLIMMLRMNIVITLVVVLVTPLSLFVARFVAKRTYSMFLIQGQERGKQTNLINEMIGNEKVVKAFSKEKDCLERFDDINDKLSKASLKAIFYSSITNPCTRFVNAVCYALVALTGIYYVAFSKNNLIGGFVTVGTLTVFLSYANQYTKPFNEISSCISELSNAVACAARVFEIIDEEKEKDEQDAVTLSDVKGEVKAQDVFFSYDKNAKLIENFNLKVSPGQKTAIVGPTGCGKTTLINLLMNFYDTDKGCIMIDNKDSSCCTKASVRKSFGMVLQDTWLLSGTIRENLLIAKEDATDEELINALKLSNAYSFVRRLKSGLDTYIGEEGSELSAGQKQLLCITRVMLKLPPMLILDEATSSIDTRTEMKIQDAFYRLMENKTSFIVAHRLSTVRNADVILVMKNGKIIEQGNHEYLMGLNGFYKELYLAGSKGSSEE